MKNSFKIFIFLYFSSYYLLYSQTIEGTITNINNKIIPTSNIVIKNSNDSEVISEYTFSKNGKYQIILKKDYQSIIIEITSYGYEQEYYIIENPKKNKKYTLNFILRKDKIIKLDEVVLTSKKKSFTIKKDTINYKVNAYRDASDRKIQDVISKIPGIELNTNTGEIKYKGKSIETVTLDGDNLFGFNYTLGTKNINVDMVEQIEAIDNYAENPLLKGIEQGGKVSLNLKLKKGKIDFSGNVDFGSGWFNGGNQSYNLNSNILGITKSYKSFATLAYNNVGINNSPFDYLSFNSNFEQQKEKDYLAEKIIAETRFSNLLDEKRTNINKQFFGNYNSIFKLNPKLNVKINLYYLQDKITSQQLFEKQFEINNEAFTTSDYTFITKKPQQYRSDLKIKYNTSKNTLFEYNIKIRQENIKTPIKIIQNQNNKYSSYLKTEDFYLKQNLLWTKKISDKKALQISIFHSFNDLPQCFNISPSKLSQTSDNDFQESQFKKTILEGKATYLGSGKNNKYIFTIGANLNNKPYKSRLFNSEETISLNNFYYKQSNLFNIGIYNFNRGNWQISPSYSVRILNQSLKQNILNQQENQNNFIFEPALKIKYNLNSISFLTANLGYNQNTNAARHFFLNQVLINNRTTIKNIPSLALQKSQRYNLLYYNNDLYNQFLLNANINYQKSTGNFFTNYNITDTTTQIEYFFLPQDNTNWNMNIQVSKYIPFIESTIKLTSNYSISNFRNIINNSDLRQNKNQYFSNSLFWKTAFEIPISFENNFTYHYSNSKSQKQSAFNNKSWQNNFKIIVKPNKRWFIILSSEYYLPNTYKKKEQFLFLDATLRHRPKNKKWETNIEFRNLTNEDNFKQIQTSDISTIIFGSNILPRYFLINITWNF